MESNWAQKRQRLFGLLFLIGLLIVGTVSYFLFIHTPPSCSDGLKNQNEKDVDCGGICSRLCLSDIANPIILWQRAFPVQAGQYSAVAYIQNPNVLTEVNDIGYVFRLYDASNALITERRGHTFIPANQTFAIFESGLMTEGRIVSRTEFDFTDIPVWEQPEILAGGRMSVRNIVLANDMTSPELTAQVTNDARSTVTKAEAVAILYDADNKAIGASRTVITNLKPQQQTNILFTWPRPFTAMVVKKEISIRVYPATLLQ